MIDILVPKTFKYIFISGSELDYKTLIQKKLFSYLCKNPHSVPMHIYCILRLNNQYYAHNLPTVINKQKKIKILNLPPGDSPVVLFLN